MWESFYSLRSSNDFKKMWVEFVRESVDSKASPMFYQYVPDKIIQDK